MDQEVLISVSLVVKAMPVMVAGYSVTFIEELSILVFWRRATTVRPVSLSGAEHRIQCLVEFGINSEYVEWAFGVK